MALTGFLARGGRDHEASARLDAGFGGDRDDFVRGENSVQPLRPIAWMNAATNSEGGTSPPTAKPKARIGMDERYHRDASPLVRSVAAFAPGAQNTSGTAQRAQC